MPLSRSAPPIKLDGMNEHTMRAISQDVTGGPEVLKETELPRPEPGVGQIQIAVRAAGVNPTDWKHRAAGLFVKDLPASWAGTSPAS